jgi:signal transduction protein with GAF and PtsI domain
MAFEKLPSEIDAALHSSAPAGTRLQTALDKIASEFEARTVTLHVANASDRKLLMVAQRGIPDHIAAITREIPYGKGMAGICAERVEPVTVCNVQTDASGQSRPGAKETGVAGAIVIPVLTADGRLVGTLGVGKSEEHEYSDAEQKVLESCAKQVAPVLGELRLDR